MSNRVNLRRLWFQIHKWIGIVLAVVLIPLSLTGSLLVWHDGLDRLAHPPRYAASGPAVLASADYVAAAAAALPAGARVTALAMPEGRPVSVTALDPAHGPQRPGPPARTTVWLDPATARVIDHGPPLSGAMRWIHVFHGSLTVPGVGRSIVGWLGVIMLVSSLTGLWLWWPMTGRWTRGLRWRRRSRADANLHHSVGFWLALPLAVLSLTGVLISFPGLIGASGGGMGPRQSGGRPQPLVRTHLSVDQAVAASGIAHPASIAWPTDKQPGWTIVPAGEGGGGVTVADATGVAQAARERRGPSLSRRIHDGDDMGLVWQLIITVAGVAPAVLGVTGILMWLGSRRRRPRAA